MSMLFRCPGPDVIWGVSTEWKIFAEDEVEKALSEGWHDHPHKASAAFEQLRAEVHAELEAEESQPAQSEPVKRGPGRPKKA
jgi:hypothetical protein